MTACINLCIYEWACLSIQVYKHRKSSGSTYSKLLSILFWGEDGTGGRYSFFTLHASALFQFLPSSMSHFSIYKGSVGVDTVTPWSPQPSSQGLCILDLHP